jgi:hypothetical protein
VEVTIDYGLTDIVAKRFDAGVRSGGQVAKDMIAVGIGPDLRMSVVEVPSYFDQQSVPKRPQDLTAHQEEGTGLAESMPKQGPILLGIGLRRRLPESCCKVERPRKSRAKRYSLASD